MNESPREVSKRLNQLAQEVDKLNRFKASVEYEKQMQYVLELIARMHASQISYANLIIAAGYAAFFTFWSTLKNDLPALLYAVSGLLITLSLLIFVGWEVAKMIWGAVHLRKTEKLISRLPPQDVISKLQQEISSFEHQVNRLWVWFLVPTIALGLLSGLCLVGFFVWKLWDVLF